MARSDRLVLEIRRSAKPFLMYVGIGIAGLIVFLIIFRNLTFQRPWQHYKTVRAEFQDVKGIFPKGHQVRLHGVKVGIVSSSDLEDGKAVLTLKIEDKFGDIYKDAKLRIRPVTPLDDLYVNVENRGTKAAGPAGKSFIIPATDTVSPVDISRVLNTFDTDTRGKLRILLSELNKALGPEGGEKLQATFEQTAPFLHVAQQATAVMHKRDVNLKRLVTNFGELSDALSKRDSQLQRLVTQGNQTLGELAANDGALGDTFDQIAELLPVMRSTFANVRTMEANLDPALRGLTPVTESLEKGLNGLEQFGREATPALKALRTPVRNLRTMSKVLLPTAQNLSAAFTRLQPQAPQFQKLTDRTADCITDIQHFFQNTISVLKFGDANGAFPRATVVVGADTSTAGAIPGSGGKPRPNCAAKFPGYTNP